MIIPVAGLFLIMKTILTALLFFTLFNSIAGKEYSLEVQVLNVYNNVPVPGCHVTLNCSFKNFKQEATTDNEGKILFEHLPHRNFTLTLISRDGKFSQRTQPSDLERKTINQSKIIYISPTKEYQTELMLAENSNYPSLELVETTDSITNNQVLSIHAKADSSVTPAFFPGGIAELQRYIVSQIQYPEESIDFEEQGRVYISFVIEKNGKISHIQIEKGVSPNLDHEAIRLVRSMPKWIPANKEGLGPIRSQRSIPIVYTLN